MKEAYTIYISGKNLAFYLDDSSITVRSDHLSNRKFLEKNTLNPEVGNWAVKILTFKIKFLYMKGLKITWQTQ